MKQYMQRNDSSCAKDTAFIHTAIERAIYTDIFKSRLAGAIVTPLQSSKVKLKGNAGVLASVGTDCSFVVLNVLI